MPRSEPQPGLAWAVRKLRTERGLSQEELAHRAGVHLTWIGRLESGATNPTWGTTKRVARGLGVPHAALAALGEERDDELADRFHGGPDGITRPPKTPKSPPTR